MHYFSIHTLNGEHLGFLIMLADDESQAQPQSGRFAVKLQSEQAPQDAESVRILSVLEQSQRLLFWRVEKERVSLFEGDQPAGSIRNEYLTVAGKQWVLNDLTGMM